MRGSTCRSVFALALTALLTAACTADPSSGGGAPYVLVLQTAEMPDGLSLVSPAVLGFGLSVREAGVTTRVVTGDADGALARSMDDPALLAVVVAPFTTIGSVATESLAAARIPVLSFSTLDPAPEGPDAPWRRFVPEADAMVGAMVSEAVALDRPTCLLAAPDPWAATIGAHLEHATHGVALFRTAATPAGCVAAVWSGPASGAASVRSELLGPLLLTDQARTDGFLEATSPRAGSTTFGFCGCADLTTSADPEQQAFVHDFQEASGLDPGPFAAEGFDAGRVLLLSLGNGAAARESLVRALAGIETFDGVAGFYSWDERGTLTAPPVRMYRAEGVRWLPEHLG